MPTQIGELGVTFPDTTLQTTAAIPGTPGFGLAQMSIFNNTSFFVVPAGITRLRVTVVGGGGGGGTNVIGRYNGGGGGGGGTAIKTISGLSPGQSINVTVGAAAGENGTGGTSAFGGYCSATGGNPGSEGYNPPGPGGGGSGINGDLNISGGAGTFQFSYEIIRESLSDYFTMPALGGGSYLAPTGSSGYGAGGSSGSSGYKGVVIVEY